MSNHRPGVDNWAKNARDLRSRRVRQLVSVGTCRRCGGPKTGKSRWNSIPDDLCSQTCVELDIQDKNAAAKAAKEQEKTP